MSKQLNNVQKKKLEEFLEKKRTEIIDKIDSKNRAERDKITAKLEANTPANVLNIFTQMKANDLAQDKLVKEKNQLDKKLEKEGYSINYQNTLSINNIGERKEVRLIEDKTHAQITKIHKIYEDSILLVWTGSQSETLDIVNKMIKSMEALI